VRDENKDLELDKDRESGVSHLASLLKAGERLPGYLPMTSKLRSFPFTWRIAAGLRMCRARRHLPTLKQSNVFDARIACGSHTTSMAALGMLILLHLLSLLVATRDYAVDEAAECTKSAMRHIPRHHRHVPSHVSQQNHFLGYL
jgi:hypothetical protein